MINRPNPYRKKLKTILKEQMYIYFNRIKGLILPG